MDEYMRIVEFIENCARCAFFPYMVFINSSWNYTQVKGSDIIIGMWGEAKHNPYNKNDFEGFVNVLVNNALDLMDRLRQDKMESWDLVVQIYAVCILVVEYSVDLVNIKLYPGNSMNQKIFGCMLQIVEEHHNYLHRLTIQADEDGGGGGSSPKQAEGDFRERAGSSQSIYPH